jgi:CheY-like chemotaxis protein
MGTALAAGCTISIFLASTDHARSDLPSPETDMEPALTVSFTAERDSSRRNAGGELAQPLRIVIADDNIDAALTLAALLGLQGHDVRTAHDGMQALDEVMRFEPHVVILDIGMPGMNGYKVASELRERNLDVLLIAITGWGQEEDRQRSRAAGFDHHLVKPVDFTTLSELLAARAAARTLH